ncbi:MAG: DNA polymerase III subunit gamma/tau [Bacilli bacterium]|nr:DNA polymerase III subunit gamma/tau [Bacilli bacterium]
MSYQALYRKYRPRNLNEVYGQKVAVNILKNAIINKKFAHAYLFTGSRGCGKTSVAKILSRLINCENPVNGMMCEECNSCVNSKINNCVDIIEIDAASNNGVDEIRELKSKVNLIPSVLKYKVYIIDEVHMLSIGAFNALLKTLEEPPEHVVFILATTELHKVPITIVSRCQTIEFKKINNKDMFDRLKEIAVSENINITDDAINEIVNTSDGGMRDAIGMLDMSTAYSNDNITEDDIYAINGNVSNNEIEYLTDQILKKNLNIVISQINEYYNNGKDLIKITEKILIELKNKMIKENDTNISLILEKLITSVEKMKNSSVGKIYLELTLFELCKNENTLPVEKSKEINEVKKDNRIEIIEKKEKISTVSVGEKIETPVMIEKNIKQNKNIKNIRINNTFVEVNKKSLNDIKNDWSKLNDYTFDKEQGALVCELLDAVPVAASTKYLMLAYNYDSFVEKGNMYVDKYEKILKNILNLDVKIVFLTNKEWIDVKKTYIENIKNNVQYNYIDEMVEENEIQIDLSTSSIPDKSSDLLEKANELFNMEKIEIKGE